MRCGSRENTFIDDNEQSCRAVNLPDLQSRCADKYSSAIAERPRDACSSTGVGHFEAKFLVEGLRFSPISMDR